MNRPFLYGGPQQQQQLQRTQCLLQTPTFESLSKNRVMMEKRFFCNNSNSKYLTLGIVPASKILDENAPGFYVEAFICGEKMSPLPLGGVSGLASLFSTMRQIPRLNYTGLPPRNNVEPDTNIVISTTNFADDVSTF